MFAGDHCSRCRKHRVTGALMAPDEMKARLNDARKVASMRTAHDQEAINQESRLKLATTLAIIAGILVVLSGIQGKAAFVTVTGVAMFFAGLQLYLRNAVKFIALFLMLASSFFLVLRAIDLVFIFSQAGLMVAGAMPMWILWSGLFLILMVTSFKILVHDPNKDATPPPVPMPNSAPTGSAPKPPNE
ncbi:hypothetical protein G5S37_30265 [Roseimicrobium sp. ORNL1]|nr:hypothetical protein G5S37_30265 [Roseimicrobium sp. ORNL1]